MCLTCSHSHTFAWFSDTFFLLAGNIERENASEGLVYLTYELLATATPDAVASFLEYIESETKRVLDFSVSQTSLEEVFLNVTGGHE